MSTPCDFSYLNSFWLFYPEKPYPCVRNCVNVMRAMRSFPCLIYEPALVMVLLEGSNGRPIFWLEFRAKKVGFLWKNAQKVLTGEGFASYNVK